MSWLSKATGIHVNLKPWAPAIGALVGSVIPGVGTALGAGAGRFLSGVGNHESVGKAALGGVGAGAGGAALGGLGGLASKIPGVSSVASHLGGEGGIGGAIKSAGGWLSGNGGRNALGVAQGINTALTQRKGNQLANRALGSAEGSYNERAPLRAAGYEAMLHPQIPNINQLYAQGANPYAKPQTPGIVPAGQ